MKRCCAAEQLPASVSGDRSRVPCDHSGAAPRRLPLIAGSDALFRETQGRAGQYSSTGRLCCGETRELLHIPAWDFNWQDNYRYQKPFRLPRGTIVKAEFCWDSSAENPHNPHHPPRLIQWGEGGSDEMSGVIVGGVTVKPGEEIWRWLAVLGHYFEVEGRAKRAQQARLRESLIPSFLRGRK